MNGGLQSVISGGISNTSNGTANFIAAGQNNSINANNSFAAGAGSVINNDYSFVWNSAFGGATLGTTASGQFLVNANSSAMHTVGTFDISASGSLILKKQCY